MLNKTPEFDYYYVAYLKDDPAREPIAASYSAPGRAATDVVTFFRDSVHPFRGCRAKEDEGGDYARKV